MKACASEEEEGSKETNNTQSPPPPPPSPWLSHDSTSTSSSLLNKQEQDAFVQSFFQTPHKLNNPPTSSSLKEDQEYIEAAFASSVSIKRPPPSPAFTNSIQKTMLPKRHAHPPSPFRPMPCLNQKYQDEEDVDAIKRTKKTLIVYQKKGLGEINVLKYPYAT